MKTGGWERYREVGRGKGGVQQSTIATWGSFSFAADRPGVRRGVEWNKAQGGFGAPMWPMRKVAGGKGTWGNRVAL